MIQEMMVEAKPDVAPKTRVHLSWNDNQDEILRTILTLYNRGLPLECDAMYSTGSFWRNIQAPHLKFDINPQVSGVNQADAMDLPLDDGIMLDPPFLVGASKTGVMKDRFTKLPNMESLKELYWGIIIEAYRVLKPKSIMIFKHQNCVSSGEKFSMSHMVQDYAEAAGFSYVDELTLIRHNPMSQAHTTRGGQQHTRSADCRFLVCRKGKLSTREKKERALLTLSTGGRHAQKG